MGDKKTDLEQLRGILNQFTLDIVRQATTEFFDQTYCRKSYKDFDDPGPEVEVGTESRVNLEEIARMERIIAEPNFLPVHFLEEGAILQRAVARITRSGSAWATGFLVSPSLLMTNNHVIPDVAFARTVEMQFNYQLDYNGNPQVVDIYSPDPDDVFYTNASLDFTLVRLNRKCRLGTDYSPYTIAPLTPITPTVTFAPATLETSLCGEMAEFTPVPFPQPKPPRGIKLPPPLTFKPVRPRIRPRPIFICKYPGETWGQLQLISPLVYATGEHVNIVQHPRGRRKEVALQKNNISNIYTNRIRYTTDTEPGSSGSPVFDNEWDLIAIHHAAGEWDSVNGVYVNNEGERMDKIVADLISNYGGTTAGQNILNELGI